VPQRSGGVSASRATGPAGSSEGLRSLVTTVQKHIGVEIPLALNAMAISLKAAGTIPREKGGRGWVSFLDADSRVPILGVFADRSII
jgi:hypothetical protein